MWYFTWVQHIMTCVTQTAVCLMCVLVDFFILNDHHCCHVKLKAKLDSLFKLEKCNQYYLRQPQSLSKPAFLHPAKPRPSRWNTSFLLRPFLNFHGNFLQFLWLSNWLMLNMKNPFKLVFGPIILAIKLFNFHAVWGRFSLHQTEDSIEVTGSEGRVKQWDDGGRWLPGWTWTKMMPPHGYSPKYQDATAHP